MLRDIFDMVNIETKIIIRIFNMNGGDQLMNYKDVELTKDNIDTYDKEFAISCIVPMQKNELLIEGTVD